MSADPTPPHQEPTRDDLAERLEAEAVRHYAEAKRLRGNGDAPGGNLSTIAASSFQQAAAMARAALRTSTEGPTRVDSATVARCEAWVGRMIDRYYAPDTFADEEDERDVTALRSLFDALTRDESSTEGGAQDDPHGIELWDLSLTEQNAALRRLFGSAVERGFVWKVPCDEEEHDDDCCEGAGWNWQYARPAQSEGAGEAIYKPATGASRRSKPPLRCRHGFHAYREGNCSRCGYRWHGNHAEPWKSWIRPSPPSPTEQEGERG